MKTAKLFRNGQSQAVRLPKEFRFEGEFVYIKRSGNAIVLLPGQGRLGFARRKPRQVLGRFHGRARPARLPGPRGALMRFMLDTDSCIALIKRKSAKALRRILSLAPGEVGISAVTLGELSFGVAKSAQREAQSPRAG